MYKHILVPTDGSALSLKAAEAAADLARKYDATITALYVIEPYMPPMGSEGMAFYATQSAEDYAKGMRKIADAALAKVKKAADAKGAKCEALSVVDSQPWEGIVRAAQETHCDMIVMSSHGRRGLTGLLLGSETTKVLTHSKTPVLVCR